MSEQRRCARAYREEPGVGGKKRPVGGRAPVVDEDVQVMREFGGVRFSVDGEARGRQCRAYRRRELRELRRRRELKVVAPVLPGRPKHVKEDRNDEG